MKIDFEYFNAEAIKFIEIMGNCQYTVEQCSDALRGLLTVYVNVKFRDDDERKRAEQMMKMLTIDHDKRLALRLQYGI